MSGFRKVVRRTQALLAGAALCGFMIAASAPKARADDDHAKCQHRVEKAERQLDAAVSKHGEHSAAAERRRQELNAERDRCWNQYHGYWNGKDQKWHDQRDWDDHRDDHHEDHHDDSH
jgi:hypothetical protein